MRSFKSRPWLRIALSIFLALFAAEAIFLYFKWPFTSERIAHSLGASVGSRVRIARFERTFFPHPGCVAQEVTFERASVKLASVSRLTVTGSWAALFALQHYVRRIELGGVNVTIPTNPPPPEPTADSKKSEARIGELLADGAMLDIGSAHGGTGPIQFKFTKLLLRNVSKTSDIGFDVDVNLPLLPSRVRASGSLGPWNGGNTPLAGSFRLQDGKLGALSGIDGTLSANGKFNGILKKVRVDGQTDVPDFRVKRHPVHLQTTYSTTVNGTTGDISIDAVDARFLGTVLQANGAIQGEQGGGGKTVSVDFRSNDARVQDLLQLVTSADRPALNGPIIFHAQAALPPGKEKFLQKLRLDGDFAIADANFTKARTQTKVNELSSRARGREAGDDDPAPEGVVSDLKGHVSVRDGTARLTGVSFSVPGANAKGGGTYGLLDKRVNLTGHVAMQATVSEASSGIKSRAVEALQRVLQTQ